MPNYQKMYLIAAGAIADALDELDKLNIGTAKERTMRRKSMSPRERPTPAAPPSPWKNSPSGNSHSASPLGGGFFCVPPSPRGPSAVYCRISKNHRPSRAERRHPWNSSF